MSDIDILQPLLSAALKAYSDGSSRSLQSAAGIIGPSDLGFCRQKATLMTRGVEQSDSKPTAAAQIGTAIHAYAGEALRAMFPHWIVDDHKVTATFPSGAVVSGTPDIIAPDYNALIDIKTVDGFSWVKREGTSLNHRYQRHTYTLGAIQEGLLDDSKPVFVGNLYIDRSGKEPEPLLLLEPYDPSLTDEIDSWISDVIYAAKHDEDAMRDIPSPVCEKICEYFTVCRGGLEVHEGGDLIEDDGLKAAIRMYVEGRDMEKEGSKLKREASTMLAGINGTDGEWQVRWVSVAPTTVQAFEKQGFDRLDVRKMRAPK
jgi:hypothetical protein